METDESDLTEDEATAELLKLTIDENKMLIKEQNQRLKILIFSYKDIFTTVKGEVGATTLTKFKVYVKENAVTYKAKV